MNNEENNNGMALALSVMPKQPHRIISNVKNNIIKRKIGNISDGDGALMMQVDDEQDNNIDLSSFNLSTIGENLLSEETVKDLTLIQCRKIERSISNMRASLEVEDDDSSNSDNMNDLNHLLKETAEKLLAHNKHLNNNEGRDGGLSWRLEDLVKLKAYYHFLNTGKLIELSECHIVNSDDNNEITIKIQDEEYLGGIIMFCSHDISRYALRRGIAKDKESIIIARDIVLELINCLLEFDFRNGPLRRKYDGLKYSLKTLENTIYELSLVEKKEELPSPNNKNENTNSSNQPETNSIVRLNKTEMDEIHKRYEAYDELREKLIKRCRDVQKYAKQSIFALHRSDYDRANTLISQCEGIINQDLFATFIQNEPKLRYGSFSNCAEEYVEAILFQTWLRHQKILSLQDIRCNNNSADIITIEEYMGGLLDVTGEIGRYAVARGTERDVKAVRFCLETVLRIWTEIQKMGGSSLLHKKFLQKKLETLNFTVKKLEVNLYELNLLKSGSNHVDMSTRLEDDTAVGMRGDDE